MITSYYCSGRRRNHALYIGCRQDHNNKHHSSITISNSIIKSNALPSPNCPSITNSIIVAIAQIQSSFFLSSKATPTPMLSRSISIADTMLSNSNTMKSKPYCQPCFVAYSTTLANSIESNHISLSNP